MKKNHKISNLGNALKTGQNSDELKKKSVNDLLTCTKTSHVLDLLP